MSTGFPDYYSGFQQPNTLYVSASDKLRVAAASSQTAETVTVYYRIWTADRQIVRGSFTVSPAADRSVSTADQTLPEGFLLSISCKAAVATTRGQTFARVFLTDAVIGLGNPSSMLMADYVTTKTAPSYPNGRVLAPSEGPGFRRFIQSAPAAGVDPVYNVPTNARWKIVNMLGTLVASATVANRIVCVHIGGGALGVTVDQQGGALTAGGTVTYNGMAGTPFTSSDFATQIIPIPPDVVLVNTNGLTAFAQFFTVGLQAGDQWGTTFLGVEEWLDNV